MLFKNKDLKQHYNNINYLKKIDKEILLKELKTLNDNNQILFIEYLTYYEIIKEL